MIKRKKLKAFSHSITNMLTTFELNSERRETEPIFEKQTVC